MAMSREQRKSMIEATKDSAAAFLEDMQHLRDLIARVDQSRGEIRRVSAILRRLLIDGTLADIAGPRAGKIKLSAPDNTAAYKVMNDDPGGFFFSGGVHVFGFALRAGLMAISAVQLENLDADRVVELRIGNFLTQRVVYWKGRWISREAIIKYVANVADGVHGGTPKGDERVIADARHSLVIGMRDNGNLGIAIRPPDEAFDEKKLGFAAAAIDLALIELFAAARFLTVSPDVVALEKIVKQELG